MNLKENIRRILREESNKKDMRIGIEYLKTIQSDKPFNTNQPLYHLTLKDVYNNKIKKEGLIPSRPKESTHRGILKGELFEGVWLTSLDNILLITTLHDLPQYYEDNGVLLKIDGSQLNPDLFSIGIELTPRLMRKVKDGEKISRNEYYKQSNEIVYLGKIPKKAITLINWYQ